MPDPSITATDKRAAEIVRMYEDAGKIVRRVVSYTIENPRH